MMSAYTGQRRLNFCTIPACIASDEHGLIEPSAGIQLITQKPTLNSAGSTDPLNIVLLNLHLELHM
ncbi:hypothetical protein D3C75_565040 [compost metagenome]